DKPDLWINREPVRETKEKTFLEINGERAVELQLAQGNSANRENLKKRYKLEKDFVIIEPSGFDTVVYVLNWWWVTVLLFVLGLVALYIELSAPGIGVGGVTAALCFALFFWSRYLGGTAGWLEVVLFVSGLTFIAVEVFIIPGFGVAGLSGMLLLLASLILAGQKGLIPDTPEEFDALRNTLAAIVVSGVLSGVTAYVISTYLGVIPVLNHLALHPPPPEELPQGNEGFVDSTSGLLVNVGDLGVADSSLRPAGKARFGDSYLDVVTDGEFINRGSRLCISEIVGTRIVVMEVQDG
ncbi:MAG: peptidase, partial [Thermoguttaceae bacterium]